MHETALEKEFACDSIAADVHRFYLLDTILLLGQNKCNQYEIRKDAVYGQRTVLDPIKAKQVLDRAVSRILKINHNTRYIDLILEIANAYHSYQSI